jgi:NCAIR mutase (PurE)-related protein
MKSAKILGILREVRRGKLTPQAALKGLRWMPFEDMGFAHVDTHREMRSDVPEVVFCQGKTVPQSEAILRRLAGQNGRALGTRATEELWLRFKGGPLTCSWEPLSRTLVVGRPPARPVGLVGVLCAGTSDIPVAEEAARTAEFCGARVKRAFDVGVAGLHRLLSKKPLLARADALIVVAGMEGALPSVVGGLARCPVVAVPTSVGYGASYGGLAALLAMMNSCAPGISVVNIDNGFGAGYLAAMMARRAGKK